jgi:hypothetical protein
MLYLDRKVSSKDTNDRYLFVTRKKKDVERMGEDGKEEKNVEERRSE